jgi:hypothetical protein
LKEVEMRAAMDMNYDGPAPQSDLMSSPALDVAAVGHAAASGASAGDSSFLSPALAPLTGDLDNPILKQAFGPLDYPSLLGM